MLQLFQKVYLVHSDCYAVLCFVLTKAVCCQCFSPGKVKIQGKTCYHSQRFYNSSMRKKIRGHSSCIIEKNKDCWLCFPFCGSFLFLHSMLKENEKPPLRIVNSHDCGHSIMRLSDKCIIHYYLIKSTFIAGKLGL